MADKSMTADSLDARLDALAANATRNSQDSGPCTLDGNLGLCWRDHRHTPEQIVVALVAVAKAAPRPEPICESWDDGKDDICDEHDEGAVCREPARYVVGGYEGETYSKCEKHRPDDRDLDPLGMAMLALDAVLERAR